MTKSSGRFNYQEFSWLGKIKTNQSQFKNKCYFASNKSCTEPLRKSAEMLNVSFRWEKILASVIRTENILFKIFC